MYHNLIPADQRSQYIDLLTKAEQLLPTLVSHPECLPIVIQAASAVRGSDDVLRRIHPPITPTHIATLATLLQKSRTYVNSFWPPIPAPVPSASPVPSVATPSQPPSTVPSASSVLSVATGSQLSSPPSVQSGFPTLPPTPSSPLSDDTAQQTLRQYLHTLSPKLQSQAAVLPSKYAELNDLHETLDRLVRAELAQGSASKDAAKERSYYAQRIDLLVRTIDAFWLRVHAERQTLEGKAPTKEYQQYLNEEEKKYPMETAARKWGDYTKAEIDQLELSYSPDVPIPLGGANGSPTLKQLIYARQERDKKYIRRAPQHLTEKGKQERILAMNELHEWGIPIERKQWEVLQSMGIDVPQDYLRPSLVMTDEERIEKRRAYDREYYHENKPASVRLNIAREQQKAQTSDNPYKQS